MNFAGSIQEVELRVVSRAVGSGPLTCGIPWPRGALQGPSRLALHDTRGRRIPLQARVLDRWPDGSVRWVSYGVDLPTWRALGSKDGGEILSANW